MKVGLGGEEEGRRSCLVVEGSRYGEDRGGDCVCEFPNYGQVRNRPVRTVTICCDCEGETCESIERIDLGLLKRSKVKYIL